MKTTAIFLVFLNFITAILSLVVIGGGAYVLSTFSEWTELFGSGSVWIAIAGGVIAFLISFLGCYGTLKENTCYLSVYGLFILGVLAATGAGLYFYNDGIAGLDAATSLNSTASYTDETYIAFNDRLLSTYTYCCSGCSTCAPVIPVGDCAGCEEVSYCGATNNGECYSKPEGETPTKPKVEISESVCTAFEKLNVEGAPIVGNVTANPLSCGGGNPRQFARNVFLWVDGNTSLIYNGSLGFAVLMGFTLLATLYVACCGSDTD